MNFKLNTIWAKIGKMILAVAVLDTTSVIQVEIMQAINRIANLGKTWTTESWAPSHLERPDILDASDKANPLPANDRSTHYTLSSDYLHDVLLPKSKTRPQGIFSRMNGQLSIDSFALPCLLLERKHQKLSSIGRANNNKIMATTGTESPIFLNKSILNEKFEAFSSAEVALTWRIKSPIQRWTLDL